MTTRLMALAFAILLIAASAFAQAVPASERETRKKFSKSDQFAPELLYFSDCVLNDRDPEPSGEEGLADVQIIEAMLESVASGRPVRLEIRQRTTPARCCARWRTPAPKGCRWRRSPTKYARGWPRASTPSASMRWCASWPDISAPRMRSSTS